MGGAWEEAHAPGIPTKSGRSTSFFRWPGKHGHQGQIICAGVGWWCTDVERVRVIWYECIGTLYAHHHTKHPFSVCLVFLCFSAALQQYANQSQLPVILRCSHGKCCRCRRIPHVWYNPPPPARRVFVTVCPGHYCRSIRALQVDTVDESENETAGRGMIANREIKEGDELFTLPIDLLLTKDAARKVHAHLWFRLSDGAYQTYSHNLSRSCAVYILVKQEFRLRPGTSLWCMRAACMFPRTPVRMV